MKLSQLVAALPDYREISSRAVAQEFKSQSEQLAAAQVDINKITPDSRQVEAGSLFVAYRGVNQDGHNL